MNNLQNPLDPKFFYNLQPRQAHERMPVIKNSDSGVVIGSDFSNSKVERK